LHLTPELVAEMEAAAKAENKTPDEWAEEAIAKYLEDREWRELLAYGREQARKHGYVESDVDRLIAEYRAEQKQNR
jgi:hypothetical protein